MEEFVVRSACNVSIPQKGPSSRHSANADVWMLRVRPVVDGPDVDVLVLPPFLPPRSSPVVPGSRLAVRSPSPSTSSSSSVLHEDDDGRGVDAPSVSMACPRRARNGSVLVVDASCALLEPP